MVDDEAAYIAIENPKAAAGFVQAILASVDHLARFPATGRQGRLQALRVFHTRRLPPASW
ncbi:type II toxin-antitoxin system RelE/ParE family toxin [Pseudomonas sp. Ma2-10]